MAKVHNWQLGRAMEYPYEAAYPTRQFAFVFNINRCIACQSCTMACKSTWTFSKGQEHMWWANVETKPYGGYPQFWDMKALQLLEKANNRYVGRWKRNLSIRINTHTDTPRAPLGMSFAGPGAVTMPGCAGHWQVRRYRLRRMTRRCALTSTSTTSLSSVPSSGS